MQVFKVGKATITRIEETYQPIYPVAKIFSGILGRRSEGARSLAGAGPLRNRQQARSSSASIAGCCRSTARRS